MVKNTTYPFSLTSFKLINININKLKNELINNLNLYELTTCLTLEKNLLRGILILLVECVVLFGFLVVIPVNLLQSSRLKKFCWKNLMNIYLTQHPFWPECILGVNFFSSYDLFLHTVIPYNYIIHKNHSLSHKRWHLWLFGSLQSFEL